jgi:hypothetical protein
MTTLDELRRANLQEQRRAAQTATPVVAPASQVTAAAEMQEKAAVPADGLISTSADHGTAVRGNGVAATAPAGGTLAPAVSAAPAALGEDDDPSTRKARAILDRLYRSLARKVVHPTGVRATVDMPPELFWRVKRYCHDHNNVTVRQLFLDLAIALLDEEGY